MRILQIRFRNLNSLAGNWVIDLTDPAFTSDGIFAITGPTGAGKSTILDAVCLALYGRTPRLPRVNKSGNEIMTRQTGDCFAEVAFETQSGHYRCSWSQHRARRNPEGELQAPQHEISNADTGEVFETSIRGVAEQIEAATGMNFDRFTRSMLLAQGDFAAFLQAAPDERAPILEQITGTAIYSDISKQIHVLRAEKQDRLKLLQAELSGTEPLSEEEEQRLKQALNKNREKDQERTVQVEKLDQSIQWLDGIKRLRDDLSKIRSDKQTVQQQVEAFLPEQDRLDAALRALELDSTYAVLAGHRSDQEQELAALELDQKAEPVAAERVRLERAAHQAAVEKRDVAQSEQQKKRPVLQAVREMDIQAAEWARQIQNAAEEDTRRKNTVSGYRKSLEEAEKRRSELREQEERLQQELENARTDAGLVEHLEGMRSRMDALLRLSREQADRNKARDSAVQEQKRATELLKEAEERHTRTAAAWVACRDALQNTDAERKTLLDGQDAAVWRSANAQRIERKNVFIEARTTLTQRKTLLRSLEDSRKRRDELQTQEKNAADRILTQEEQQKILEARLEIMDQRVELLRDVQDLDALRTRLQDGKPCPLCGATDHPYAAGQVPVVAEAEKERTELRTRLQELRKQMATDTAAHARTQAEIQHLEADVVACTEAAQREKDKLITLLRRLDPEQERSADDPELDGWLNRAYEQAIRASELATEQMTRMDELEAVREQRQQDAAAARDVADKAERAYREARHAQDAAEQEVRRTATGIEEVQTQLQSAQTKVWDELAVYGVSDPTVDTLGDVLEQLTRRRDAWTRMSQDLVTIEREKASLDSRIGPLSEALDEAVKATKATEGAS